LDRLNKATSQRGMKSKLAKVMEVPLSNVSQCCLARESQAAKHPSVAPMVERQEGQQKALVVLKHRQSRRPNPGNQL